MFVPKDLKKYIYMHFFFRFLDMDKAKKPQTREPSQHTDSKVLYFERVDLCFINLIAQIIFKIIFKIYLSSETKGTICYGLFGLRL